MRAVGGEQRRIQMEEQETTAALAAGLTGTREHNRIAPRWASRKRPPSDHDAEQAPPPPPKVRRRHSSPEPPRGTDSGGGSRGDHGGPARAASPSPSYSRSSEAGSENIPGSMISPQEKQISTALALRKKYTLGVQQLFCSLVGFDPENRDGVPIGGERCDELLGDVCLMGFDLTEANHDNVVAQVRPGCKAVGDHNVAVCSGSMFFAPACASTITFATLSHSHLHQCLKNIRGGATASAPAEYCHDGRLNLELVRRKDPALAESCDVGLRWEVLAWQVRDEPGALRIIQAACNRKIGSQMKETEMQAVSRLSDICASLARSRGDATVPYAEARQRLARTMPAVADSADFTGLLRFVVSLGAERAPFLKYARQFIGLRGQGRHVRLSLFSEASKLPDGLPHIMIAMIVMAYTAPKEFFTDGISRYVSPSDFKVFSRDGARSREATASARKAEALLRYFHHDCQQAGVFAGHAEHDCVDFFALLDSTVARFMTEKHCGARHEQISSLAHIADIFESELLTRFKCTHESLPDMRTLIGFEPAKPETPSSAPAASQRSSKNNLEPKVIEFEHGVPLTQQDTWQKQVDSQKVPWHSSTAGAGVPLEIARAQLMHALRLCDQALMAKVKDRIEIWRTDGDMGVRSSGEHEEGEIAFVPMVSSISFVNAPAKRGQPNPLAVEVAGFDLDNGDDRVTSLMIAPCCRQPPRGVSYEDCEKPWFVHPFWAMKRVNTAPGSTAPAGDQEMPNMEIQYMSLDQIFSASVPLGVEQVQVAGYSKMRVPVAVNTGSLTDGDALIIGAPKDKKKKPQEDFRWDSRPRGNPKKEDTTTKQDAFV